MSTRAEPASAGVRGILPIATVTVALIAVITGLLVAGADFSYRQVIVVIVAVAVLFSIFGGQRGLRWGFVGFVCTFGLGYRTMPVTANLKVHPAEVLLWSLLAGLVIRHAVILRRRIRLWLPRWLWLMLPFLLWGWVPGLEAGRAWDTMLSEFRNFLLLVPLFVIATHAVTGRRLWDVAVGAFYGVGVWIAGMGLLEYLFPQVGALFPAFVGNVSSTITGEGFSRASFSFWGTPAATFVCALCPPMAIPLWRWHRATATRVMISLGCIILLGGIYVGGYRSMWLLMAVDLVLFSIHAKRYLLALLMVTLSAGAYTMLPTPTQDRVISLTKVLEARAQDSSGTKRWDRAGDAWGAALSRPTGWGWAGAGWVHSDFLQIAANLGLLPAILFLSAYIATLIRLRARFETLARTQHSAETSLPLALILSFVGVGWILTTQGVEVLPQLVLPVWFVWVMGEVWLRQTVPRRSIADAPYARFGSSSYLQQRRYRARHARVHQVGRRDPRGRLLQQ